MNGLWSILRCPSCRGELTLERFSGDAQATVEGLLRCPCGLWFPVTNGIPRIFVGEMRIVYLEQFQEFLTRHHLTVDTVSPSSKTRAKLDTQESFGFEWSHFHEMLPEWEENARYYFEPLGGVAKIRGLLALDAGCGKGRHAYHALKHGARLVAVDFSRAIDVAKANVAELEGDRLFVQADLLNLPFAPETFDLAYSFGVLHHLPDPETGFNRIIELVRPGGRVLIYLYHALEGEPVKQTILRGVSLVRKLTTRMPHRLLLGFSTALGYGLYGGVVMPYRLLSRFASTRALAETMPLKIYARYPVRVIVNDQFDRFSAPIENRYRRGEVEGWLTRAGLVNPLIFGGAGWRAVAEKPVSSGAS